MRIVRREFYGVSRRDIYKIIPIGDIHFGSVACDEKLFKAVVKRVEDENALWIGMADYCEFINRTDPRYDPEILADWIDGNEIDLARVQRDYFLDEVRPVAKQCLALVEGNHERTIRRHYERDIYREIVADIKENGRFESLARLAIGYYGWLQLIFHRSEEGERKQGTSIINVNLHHGFTGGKLAGGKALDMQRWLWTHNADLVLMGHSHTTSIQKEAVEWIDRSGKVRQQVRCGAFTGTFLRSTAEGVSTYSEMRGMLPLPIGGVEVTLRPYAKQRVTVSASA